MSGESDRAFSRIGIGLALLGLAFNPFIVAFCFAPDGRIISSGWILLITLCEALLIIGGMTVWRKRKSLDRKAFLFGTITTLITIASIETGLHVLQHIIRPDEFRAINSRLKSSVYEHKSWADSLFRENGALDIDLEPTMGWKTQPYHGKFINIDSAGVRRTMQSAISPSADSSCSLYCFGGSTMFGSYVRDGGTIPSFLSSFLSNQDVPCCVVNYGDQGYTFKQEIMKLTLMLRDNSRPTDVLFYDGVNDVISCYYAEHPFPPGLLSPLYKTVELMKQPFPRRLGVITRDYLEENLLLFRAFDRLAGLLFGPTHSRSGRKNYSASELEEMSRAIVQEYKASYDLLLRLSASYHFKIFCFLQPVIFTKENPTTEELNVDREVHDERFKKLYLDTYSLLGQSGLQNFYDLSGALNQAHGTYYVDFCHLSEEGNQIVAAKMATVLMDQIGRDRTSLATRKWTR